jgi:glycine/D-amino acid oxidase-like deaminating enzyme
VRWLSRGDLDRAFPLLSFDDVEEAFLMAMGGVLLARRIAAALVKHLVAAGVALRPHRAVSEVDPERARARLNGSETLEADAIVVAAGAWTRRLLPALAPRAVPSRQVVAYVEPPRLYAARWTIAPVVLELGPRTGFYIVPPVAGTSMKLADRGFTLAGDPDDDRNADPEEAAATLAAARRRLREFDRYRLARLRPCYHTVEPENRLLVEKLGRAGWVVSACSGHGYKFAPLLAQRLAETIAGERWPAKLTKWAAGQG